MIFNEVLSFGAVLMGIWGLIIVIMLKWIACKVFLTHMRIIDVNKQFETFLIIFVMFSCIVSVAIMVTPFITYAISKHYPSYSYKHIALIFFFDIVCCFTLKLRSDFLFGLCVVCVLACCVIK